jgi:hypothetical protein
LSRKRGNGERTIHRRKDGGWCAQYTVYTAEGRKRKSLYGKPRAEVRGSWPRRSLIARVVSFSKMRSSRWGSTSISGSRIPYEVPCDRVHSTAVR